MSIETLESTLQRLVKFHGMPTVIDTLAFICDDMAFAPVGRDGKLWSRALATLYEEMTVGSNKEGSM